jgi:hypothetical protein
MRKLRNKEVYYLYYLPGVIRVMKSSGMKWARHLARIQANRRYAHKVLVAKPEINMSSCIPY